MAELLKISVPVSANRLIISSLSAIEFVLIPTMLISGGLDSKTSMEVFGRLTGMALPLIMLPSIATNSLATTLVPAISESVALKSYKSLNYQISKSIQATFIIGVIFSALFICYPNEIGELVYRREKIGDLLFMLSFSCIFVYLQQTLNGILNGLGKQGVLLRNTVIGSLLRIASVYFLIPSFGIKSYILGFTVSHLVTEMMNLITVSRMTGLVFNVRDWLLKPCLAGAAMIFAGKYIYGFYRVFFTNNHLITLLASATNIMAAGVFMTATGVMNPDEILKMTGLRKNEKRR